MITVPPVLVRPLARSLAGAAMLLALPVAFLATTPGHGAAQLISPGALARPHAELEGIRNCTRCHELGRRGVAPELCLDCHTPLAGRLARDEGFHATLAVTDCASCHRDHYGDDFALIKLDTLAFDHARAGFQLEGAHRDAGCRSCHAPDRVVDAEVRRVKSERGGLERTFLGLTTGCVDCHTTDDPHADRFEDRSCADCHDQSDWVGAEGFDHDDTGYRLTGRHRSVECAGCHADLPPRVASGGFGTGVALEFAAGPAGSCTNCHADPHSGTMAGDCSSCHSTAGWLGVDRTRVASRFDHGTTDFALVGSHEALDCAACHDAAQAAALAGIALTFDPTSRGHAFPRPAADSCMACHVDRHDGLFADRPGGPECTECHGQTRWLPADYDLARHNAEAAFALEGAHAVVPCVTCHETEDGTLRFDLGVPGDCTDCHAVDDPHGEQFEGRACTTCHGVDAFTPVVVDHDATRYPLEGVHATLACDACHGAQPGVDGRTRVRYRPLGTECRDCHGGEA
jgi:hypothetical protein